MGLRVEGTDKCFGLKACLAAKKSGCHPPTVRLKSRENMPESAVGCLICNPLRQQDLDGPSNPNHPLKPQTAGHRAGF